MSERLRRALPFLAIVIPIIALALVATRLAGQPLALRAIAFVRDTAHAWWALPLFVVLYTLCTIFFIPVSPLSAAAAVAWGWKLGGTIELVTCTVAALVPYALARRGLAPWVARRIHRDDLPLLDSTFTLLLLRIVPIVPFVALNYIAGATRVRTRDYVLATFAGSIPITYLFAWFVDTLAAGAMGMAAQIKIFAACAAVALVAIALRFIARRVARRA